MHKFIQQLALVAALLWPLYSQGQNQAQTLPLMPYPQQVIAGDGRLVLDEVLYLDYQGGDALVEAALTRFEQRLAKQSGRTLRIARNHARLPRLKIQVNSKHVLSNSLSDWDETYQLAIVGEQIQINAPQNVGVLRALETLLQLAGTTRKQKIELPQLVINDAPRFAWRGLLLDCSRHFFSLETIKRQLDVMAAAKLNVFHWHLSDDQGWRFESRAYPKLQQLAADGDYYTQAQMRELVAYARARGIQVLPEIDMPGHASAIAVAYPELMSAPGPYQMNYAWGVHLPTLDPSNPAVYEFADKIFAELADIFPFDYVHIGGDEVDPQQWQTNAAIQAFMTAHQLSDAHDLQAYFNQQLYQLLKKHKRKMIGWDEIQHPDLPRDIIVQSWRGPDGVSAAVSQGFKALLSTGYYLDQAQSAAYHYRQDPIPPAVYKTPLPAADQDWQSWRFSMARQRGAPVTGQLSVIFSPVGDPLRAFVDFKDKSRRPLQLQLSGGNQWLLSLDTWMGPVQFKLNAASKGLQDELMIGNTAYPLTAELVAARAMGGEFPLAGIAVPAITPGQQALVKGGEAALWSEIVDEQSIDSRLWPRAFVVAERLWSPAEVQDQSRLWSRIETTMTWARQSSGLADLRQQRLALERLAGKGGYQSLATFAEALEPAQYYYRQHQKSATESYSRADPLNRLVDALAIESSRCAQLAQASEQWLLHKNSESSAEISRILRAWRDNHPELNRLLTKRTDLQVLQPLAQTLDQLAALGLAALAPVASNSTALHPSRAQAQAQLLKARGVHQEMVLCALVPVQKLVQASPNFH